LSSGSAAQHSTGTPALNVNDVVRELSPAPLFNKKTRRDKMDIEFQKRQYFW
jgi:hypothetical protein